MAKQPFPSAEELPSPPRPTAGRGRPSADSGTQPQLEAAATSSFFDPTGFGGFLQAAQARQAPGAGSAFDVCHIGVALRAVLFVQGVIAVGVLFFSSSPTAWLAQMALGSALSMPAVLLWLVSACLLKRPLARLPVAGQWAAAVALGALSGSFGFSVVFAGGEGLGLLGGLKWPAPLAAGACLSAAVFYWLRLRADARMPADTAARLAELQSRIRPHFLFNTLNTAIALARRDPARTETLLEDLAELFRVALSESGESVSLADEVALARRYLDIEQLRFGQRLKVTWELDEQAGAARVPPLLLQPLVENAVRHGVEPSAEGGTVRVRTRVKAGHAVISIANTVPGRPSRPGNGIALRNVRERLKLMHDVSAKFEAGSDGKLFRVQMVVPL